MWLIAAALGILFIHVDSRIREHLYEDLKIEAPDELPAFLEDGSGSLP
jgi:hypothetical protein